MEVPRKGGIEQERMIRSGYFVPQTLLISVILQGYIRTRTIGNSAECDYTSLLRLPRYVLSLMVLASDCVTFHITPGPGYIRMVPE